MVPTAGATCSSTRCDGHDSQSNVQSVCKRATRQHVCRTCTSDTHAGIRWRWHDGNVWRHEVHESSFSVTCTRFQPRGGARRPHALHCAGRVKLLRADFTRSASNRVKVVAYTEAPFSAALIHIFRDRTTTHDADLQGWTSDSTAVTSMHGTAGFCRATCTGMVTRT